MSDLAHVEDSARSACPACRTEASDFREYTFQERQFATGESFRYLECSSCETLFLHPLPDDLGRYYPRDYYSFNSQVKGGIRNWLQWRRDLYAIAGRGVAGGLLARVFPLLSGEVRSSLAAAGVSGDARILDVGSGSGYLLRVLRGAGYRDLTGLDPFLPAVPAESEGVRVIQQTIEEYVAAAGESRYDLIMFNHSLEHIPDPEGALRAAATLLAPGGRVLVRIPIRPCEAWERFQGAWVLLDAPRHTVIFSRDGIRDLARRCGLSLLHSEDDSTAAQSLGSRLYAEGRPLGDLSKRFGFRERWQAQRNARRLNRKGRGDQAAFIFSAGAGPATAETSP